ncbi:hypothetical protein AB0P21_13885 [Kribbella sp. NPDC056861]|uniref:hypothetical protein n=1 Tax=Kribbella sp. NPDC056861 TaxID=3154857 RepID=UPI00341EF46A
MPSLTAGRRSVRWLTAGAIVLIVVGVSLLIPGSTEDAACTLNAPARIAVDQAELEFTATKVCTGRGPSDVTWTAAVGSTETSELRFRRTDSAVAQVFSNDPFGQWTWTVTRTDRSGADYNAPVTEVRAGSTVTVAAARQASSGTEVTFQVNRYDPKASAMVPWAGATATIESRKAPADDNAPFAPAGSATSDGEGIVVLTLRPRVDTQYRARFADAAEVFGATSDYVFVGR